jgi:hypothetical protein
MNGDIIHPNGRPARQLSIVMPDGSERPVESPLLVERKPHVLEVQGEGQDQRYRWKRNDGKVHSPVFTILQEALAYAAVMPLLTRDEWQAMEVPPEWLALNKVQSEGPPAA